MKGLILGLLLVSTLASAKTKEEQLQLYRPMCQLEALEELTMLASTYRLRISEDTLRVTAVVDEWYNPVISIYYEVETIGSQAKVRTVIRKIFMPKEMCI